MWIRSFWPTSTIFGVTMQEEQSSVGKVLSSWAILPPMVGFDSTISTSNPASAISRAVCIPAMPPPITSARFVTGVEPAVSGLSSVAFATAAFISAIAFCVPTALSLWTQEHCSRMLATSSIYGFMPTDWTALRNVFSCILGEQVHITTLVS